MKKLERKNVKKISLLQCVLTVILVSCLMLSNIVVIKSIPLPFGFEITGALYIFPVTYILSDIFSEVYGYRWSRISSYMAFGLSLFMSIVFAAVIASPGTEYFTLQESLVNILGSTPRFTLASILAFVIGDFCNDRVFRFMRRDMNSHKGFCIRAIGSSMVGALLDTTVFYLIAFTGSMSIVSILAIAVSEMILKVAYELIILPLTVFIMHKVDNHEKSIA